MARFRFPRRSRRADGDDRDRTGNLRLAKPALSQLSYIPQNSNHLNRSARRRTLSIPDGRTWIRTTDLTLIRGAL